VIEEQIASLSGFIKGARRCEAVEKGRERDEGGRKAETWPCRGRGMETHGDMSVCEAGLGISYG